MQIMDTVLVTGAGGFIGSHLVEALLEMGCAVRALVKYNSRNHWGWLEDVIKARTSPSPGDCVENTELGVLYGAPESPRLEVVSGDVTDAHFTRRLVEGCHTVFHLAALIGIPYSYVAPGMYVDTNITGTLNILEACRIHGVQKLVHTSTSETYGTAQYTPIDEKHPLQGQSPYSASKVGADKLAESYFCSFDLPVAVIRPFNTFGPRQSARAIIPTIISQIFAGRDPIQLGALDPVRDFTYVKDTARGFIAIAQADACTGQVTNIGNGQGITMGELASRILHLADSKAAIATENERIRPGRSEVMALICDNQLASERADWKPAYTLDEGLAETIDFIKHHPNEYKAFIYNR